MKTRKILFGVLIFSILITACGSAETSTLTSTQPAAPTNTAKAPEAATAYPAPVTEATPSTSGAGEQAGLYPYPDPGSGAAFVPPPTITGSVPYPGPGDATSTPQNQAVPTEIVVPTASAGLGIVTGIMRTPDANGEPYLATLYLASTVQASDPNYPPLIAFSEADDPKAVQDASGRFLFIDVEPGEYALLIWTPVGNTVIEDPETEQYFVFTVEAGKVLDLGVIPIK